MVLPELALFGRAVRRLAAGVVALIRIDAMWLAVEPIDMRAGADRLLTVVVNTLGEASAHHGYLFANARASRLKLLVHDGFGLWLCARRLHRGGFVWASNRQGEAVSLTPEQLQALVIGLPWQPRSP